MNVRRTRLKFLVWMPWIFAFAACVGGGVEVDDKAIIGNVYEVVGNVYAVGVRSDLGSQRVDTIWLGAYQLRGVEILWARPVARGSLVTIKNRHRRGALGFVYPATFRVVVDTLPETTTTPTYLDLTAGIESAATILNPELFKRRP